MRFIVPHGIDDPARVSGGNVYDRAVRDGLRARGWDVEMVEQDADGSVRVSGAGPLLIDGLAAMRMPPHGLMQLAHQSVTPAAAHRLMREGHQTVSTTIDHGFAVLAHMVAASFPDASRADVEAERRAFALADRVIATSRWTADELARCGVDDVRIAVAPPGVHAAPLAAAQGRELLCVGVLAPHKGQDVLLAALARLCAADWTCTIVGSPDTDPAFAERIAREAAQFGGRIRLTGVLSAEPLADVYAGTALLVAPSRIESAGMAIAEARARGIPIVATNVGGIPDTVAGGGAILVPPGDPDALARVLGAWMTDPALRDRLRHEAAEARRSVPTWDDTLDAIEDAMALR